jgi:hypothetical protein
LAAKRRALSIVGDDLGLGEAGLADLGVDQDDGNLCVDQLLDGRDALISTGRVEQHALDLVVDGGLDQLVLLVGIILVCGCRRFVTELLELGLRGVDLSLPVRVGRIDRDNGDGAPRGAATSTGSRGCGFAACARASAAAGGQTDQDCPCQQRS